MKSSEGGGAVAEYAGEMLTRLRRASCEAERWRIRIARSQEMLTASTCVAAFLREISRALTAASSGARNGTSCAQQ